MARKGNQQKNGVDRFASNHKKRVSDSGSAFPDAKGQGNSSEAKVFPGEQLPDYNLPTSSSADSARKANHVGDENKFKQSSGKFHTKEKLELDLGVKKSVSSQNNSTDCSLEEENGIFHGYEGNQKHTKCGFRWLLHGLHMKNMMENLEISSNVVIASLKLSVLSMFKVTGEWLERQRPLFDTLSSKLFKARDYAKMKIEQAYPVVLKWLTNFGKIMLLLSMVWLDCTLRGIDSFLRLGTTSFFSVIWCSILSVLAMVGMSKFLISMALAAFVGVFIGLTLGLLVVGISGVAFVWLYGSFWTTLFVIVMGGLAFILSHERLALFVTTVYSVYSAWTYVGLLGLILALNLSFISSDILTHLLKNNINKQRRSNSSSEQSGGMEGQQGFSDGMSFQAAFCETGPGLSADRGCGAPSTSGDDSELNSEDEIIRLLNCTDHYSVIGLSCYGNVDISLLKREYRKKAMLVHPDKNMGNEKAAEAFKKLQNAYEVLLDSSKQKAYNDELRRKELLNYFSRFQRNPQKNGECGFFASGFAHPEDDGKEPFRDSRQIACKKCNNFHVWVHTKRSKSRARWCQDCKDFHQAKDGDGWVEQSSLPFFFGLLQKVDAPAAYICADSKIYDATAWYTCQGMRCPANTHKPSFHVNTGVTSKHNYSKGSSSGQGSSRMPEETMTEEEFFEWLQNAMQSGVFDNFSNSTSAESPSTRAGNGSKGRGGGGTSGSKRKKKGKKQW
uniref:J domain-containing protein n=1 Tax=Rhizophora mucronata TaxID=61149 RepID=A0A2P2MBY8_RHIMU